jgi:epsin
MSAGATSSVATSATTTTTKSSGGGFDDLWGMSLGSAVANKPVGSSGGKSIRDLEKEKAQAGIWGVQNQRPSMAGGFESFAKSAGLNVGGGGAPAGADDLLL